MFCSTLKDEQGMLKFKCYHAKPHLNNKACHTKGCNRLYLVGLGTEARCVWIQTTSQDLIKKDPKAAKELLKWYETRKPSF